MAAILSWQIPTVTVNNTFSVTLVSDQKLMGVTLQDFVFRRDDGSVIQQATTVATLNAVTGTNNWRLDATLTGTHDADFFVRLKNNRVTDQEGDSNSVLNSANFRVDSSEPEPSVPLSIESIDEQFIPLGTEDYVLLIDIGGDPDRAYVDGDMEGFYHEWRETDSQIAIVADDVTRLLQGAVWNIHLVKGSDTLGGEIIYNVVPVAPVLIDPGEQLLYKGHDFLLKTQVANDPKILRGSGLLVGLKSDKDEDDDGNLFLMNEGRLPSAANLTESSFMARQYAENDGGSDELDVRVTIPDGVYWKAALNYSNQLVELMIEGPDGTVLPSTTRINADITGEGGSTLTTVYSIDLSLYYSEGILSLADDQMVLEVDLTRISGTGSLAQFFAVNYTHSDNFGAWTETIDGTTNASGDLEVHGESQSLSNDPIYGISSAYPVNITLPGDDIIITSFSSPYASYDSTNGDPRIDIDNLQRTVTRSSSLTLPNLDYGAGYSRNIALSGSGFNTDATLVFRFDVDGVEHTVEFDNFNYRVNRSEVEYFELQT